MQPIRPINRPVAPIAPIVPVARPMTIVPAVQTSTPQPVTPIAPIVPVARPMTIVPVAQPIVPVTRPVVPQQVIRPVAPVVRPTPIPMPAPSPATIPVAQPVAWPQAIARPVAPTASVATGGGIMGRLARGRTNVTQAAVMAQAGPTAVPQFTIIQENEETLLRSLNHVWPATDAQIVALLAATYAGGSPVITLQRRDIIMEIIGMIIKNNFESILDFIQNAPNPEFILWDQSAMDESRVKLAREITIQQAEQVGIKGVGKCRYCASKELVFSMKQMRSGDEPMTVFVRCVLCNKQWRE